MAKKVFFSFHYDDVAAFRANVVRQSWVTRDREEAGFFDASLWEKTKTSGDRAVKSLIDGGINGTSHTAVLIGSETYNRRWVRYEIFRSIELNKGISGIHINKIQCKNKQTKYLGPNPFDFLGVQFNDSGTSVTPAEFDVASNKWVVAKDIESWKLGVPQPSQKNSFKKLSDYYQTHCWVSDDGYSNFSKWIGV